MTILHWLFDNRDVVQVLSGLLLTALTAILIVITGIYAAANWKTAWIMEADLRVRTQPYPQILEIVPARIDGGRKGITIRLEPYNAPMQLIHIQAVIYLAGEAIEFVRAEFVS
jgi:hypothetical protein